MLSIVYWVPHRSCNMNVSKLRFRSENGLKNNGLLTEMPVVQTLVISPSHNHKTGWSSIWMNFGSSYRLRYNLTAWLWGEDLHIYVKFQEVTLGKTVIFILWSVNYCIRLLWFETVLHAILPVLLLSGQYYYWGSTGTC